MLISSTIPSNVGSVLKLFLNVTSAPPAGTAKDVEANSSSDVA
jgi:hypothetical protein